MASVELAKAYVSLIPSAQGITSAIQSEMGAPLTAAAEKAGTDSGNAFSSKFKKIAAAGVAAGGVALLAFGKQAVGAASDMDESLSKVDVVFGDQAGAIKDWSKTSAKAFGLSSQQALEAAGTYGNLFSAFGVGKKDTEEMSTSLVGLASDLASFNNTSVDDALLALRSGLSGETEPLKRYGVAISDARLKTEAVRLGLIKTTKEALTPAAKAQASYSLIMADSVLAQGDFSRTSDGLANKQRILAASFGDLQAKLGTALIPILEKVVGFITDKLIPAIETTVKWLKENIPPAVKAVQDAFDKVWPIIENVIKQIEGVWKIVKGVFDAFADIFRGDWGKLWEDLGKIFGGIKDLITGVIGQFWEELKLLAETAGKAMLKLWLAGMQSVWDNILFPWLVGIPLKILDAIKDANLWLLGKGKDILLGLVHGLESGISDVFTWFFNLPVKIKDWVLEAGSWLFDAGGKIIKGFWEGMKKAWNAIADFATFKLPKVHIPGTNIDFGGNTISLLPHLAKGAMDFAGGLAVVGERGPELVNLPRGSDVFANGTPPPMTSPPPINVTINTMLGNPQEIMRVLQPVLRNYQRALS